MNRHNAKQFIPIVQALANGERIQTKVNDKWVDCDINGFFTFSLDPSCYRIKPKAREWGLLTCKDYNFGYPVVYQLENPFSHRCKNCENVIVVEKI